MNLPETPAQALGQPPLQPLHQLLLRLLLQNLLLPRQFLRRLLPARLLLRLRNPPRGLDLPPQAPGRLRRVEEGQVELSRSPQPRNSACWAAPASSQA